MRIAIHCSWVSSSEILNRGDKMVQASDEIDSWYSTLIINNFLFNRISLRLVIFKEICFPAFSYFKLDNYF